MSSRTRGGEREREFNFNIMTLLIVTWLSYADAVSSNKHRFKYNF